MIATKHPSNSIYAIEPFDRVTYWTGLWCAYYGELKYSCVLPLKLGPELSSHIFIEFCGILINFEHHIHFLGQTNSKFLGKVMVRFFKSKIYFSLSRGCLVYFEDVHFDL